MHRAIDVSVVRRVCKRPLAYYRRVYGADVLVAIGPARLTRKLGGARVFKGLTGADQDGCQTNSSVRQLTRHHIQLLVSFWVKPVITVLQSAAKARQEARFIILGDQLLGYDPEFTQVSHSTFAV